MCILLSISLFTVQDAEAHKHRAKLVDFDGTLLDEIPGVHPQDSLALVAYYYSMNGDYWLDNSGWLVDNVDFWVGVHTVANVGTETEPEWRVTRMAKLSDNMPVPGVFPPQMKDLTHLQRYDYSDGALTGGLEHLEGLEFLSQIFIRSNLLVGEIPFDILGELPRLEYLQIYNIPQRSNKNRIVGQLPAFPEGSFTRLQRIDFFGMQMDGEIPPEITNLPDLERLRLAENYFTGEVPDLSSMSEMTYLQLFDNDFTPGPIWPWLQDMGDHLEHLEIWNTNRTGTVPEWFVTDMHELTNLGFGEGVWNRVDSRPFHDRFAPENALGGTIPNMTSMVELRRLRIYGLNFTGPMPEWIGQMPSVDRIYIIGTGFEGDIPDNFFDLFNQDRVYIVGNPNLTGTFPDGMANATNLDRIQIFDNPGMTVGQLPEWLGELTTAREMNFSNIGITGTIPDNWINLTALGILELRDNPGLTGPIPDWVQERDFTRLSFSRTSMDIPEIPEWLQNQDRLIRLELAGLGMEGEIPDWMGDYLVLSHLALDDNNLSGSLSALGNLALVDSVMLANNNFSGELTEEFARIGRITDDYYGIQKLDISGNEGLTGPIPLAFTEMTHMQTFNYDGTDLCEPEDQEFHDWLDYIAEAPYMKYPPFPSSVSRNNNPCDPVSAFTDDLPSRFYLHRNYPNPFNPSTTIKYEIPSDVHVVLNVYNVLGQKVATLVNETQSAGEYEINFDAASLSSGTYIYRLDSGDRSISQTMMLIK